MADKMEVPQFATEAEEAQWWYGQRDTLTARFEAAAARGELRRGTAAQLLRERTANGTTPTTSIRLDPTDVARARELAAKRGLRYQTYLKMLLHEALEAEAKKLAS